MCNLRYKKIKEKCLTLKKLFSIFRSPPFPINITSTYFHPPPNPAPPPLFGTPLQSTIGFVPDTAGPSPKLSIIGDFNSEPYYKD